MEPTATPILEPIEDDLRQRTTILIVEDDQSQVNVLRHRLQNQGFQTVETDRGESALTLAREERPQLIILDLCLPDVDGFSVCEQLADDQATAEIPVIILSAMEQPDIIRRSRAAGCSYYVRKPYDPNALLILIERAIDEAQMW